MALVTSISHFEYFFYFTLSVVLHSCYILYDNIIYTWCALGNVTDTVGKLLIAAFATCSKQRFNLASQGLYEGIKPWLARLKRCLLHVANAAISNFPTVSVTLPNAHQV